VNHHSFYLIGLTVFETSKECSINSQGTPGMSAGFHANTMMFSLRKLTSVSSYLGSRVALMRYILVLSPGTSSTSFVSLDFAVARVASLLKISRSMGGIFLVSVMDCYIHIESSR
jgi:hypothetical protein